MEGVLRSVGTYNWGQLPHQEPQGPLRRSKVEHFDNLKLYQRRNPEMDVSWRNQTGKQGSLEKEGKDVLESPEGSGIICWVDLSEDRGVYELQTSAFPYQSQ